MRVTTRTIIIGICAVLVLGVGYLLFFVPGSVKHSCADVVPQPRITAFGDSLIAGYGGSEGGFVTLLSQKAGIPITNLGRSGETTAQGKERLDSVLATKPDITLILLGGNDALRRVPETETEKNFEEILSEIQKSGSQVILLGVLGGFPRDPYAPMFKRLAEKYGVTYVPNVLSGIIARSNLMSDSIHPNQDGYQMIADRILPILEEECSNLQ